MDVKEILSIVCKRGVSDIHFKAGTSPMIRMNGKLVSTGLDNFPAEYIHDLAYSLMDERQRIQFETEDEIDLSYTLENVSHFRVNIYRQRGTIAVTLRVVPLKVNEFNTLNLPTESLTKLCHEVRGLILISGITGAGKTTTLNAMVDFINRNFCYNIVTVEDPIEFRHQDVKSTVSQREVGIDTRSYKNALKYVLRQDPDVIVIGETRDYDSIATSITAAETGHLVIATIHTIDTVQSIDRIIGSYPTFQQDQARVQLAHVLKGIVAQRLLPLANEEGRIPATEILIRTPLIRKLIIEHNWQDIYRALEKGEFYGMHTFDQSLISLYREGKISLETATEHATNVDDLLLKIKGIRSSDSSGTINELDLSQR